MKSEYIEEDKIKEIALQIQSEFQMGGLADGIYLDFAIEVAKRYDDFRRGTALTQTHNNALKVAVKEIENTKDGSDSDCVLDYAITNINNKNIMEIIKEQILRVKYPSCNLAHGNPKVFSLWVVHLSNY